MAFDIRLVDPGLALFIQIGSGLGIDIPPHRVVPVRFARAVSGFADASAPDIDDRGFTDSVHGPAVGVMRGQDVNGTVQPGPEVRVKVIRDRILSDVKLFPVFEDCSAAELVFPPPGKPLDEDGDPFDPKRGPDIVAFRAISTDGDVHDCTLSIRHGSVQGTVMARMLVRVYPVKLVVVQIHRITVKGVAPTTTAADFDTIFALVNRIYAQAGVRFVLVRDANGSPLSLDDTFTGGGEPGELVAEFGVDTNYIELPPVSNLQYGNGRLNVYIVHAFNEHNLAGIGVNRTSAAHNRPPMNPSLFLRDLHEIAAGQQLQAMAHSAAHEIGHTLSLGHFQDCASRQLQFRCNSLWARRSLMYTDITLKRPGGGDPDFSAASRVGYGTLAEGATTFFQSGQLLSTKPFKNLPQGDEIDVIRKAIDARTFTL
jgi:hypothetical protein